MEQFLSKIQKTLKIFLVFILTLLVSSSAYSIKPKWYSKLRQIKLMSTTKQEVEKLFEYPKVIDSNNGQWSYTVTYKLKEGELSISYSLGRCSEKNKEGYDVEKDIVIDTNMDLSKEVRISKLGLDLSNYDRREISDLVGVFTYANDDLGERLTGTSKKIRDIDISPSKEQEKLDCKNALNNKR